MDLEGRERTTVTAVAASSLVDIYNNFLCICFRPLNFRQSFTRFQYWKEFLYLYNARVTLVSVLLKSIMGIRAHFQPMKCLASLYALCSQPE